MFTFFDGVAASSSSRLIQCGYRSKVCTNPRATKIDGSLHNLCEFHRRKANLSQQRLHKRHRDEHAALKRSSTATEGRPTKRAQLTVQIPVSVDLIPFTGALFDVRTVAEECHDKIFSGGLAPEDIELLDLLLLDETNTMPDSPNAVDGINSRK